MRVKYFRIVSIILVGVEMLSYAKITFLSLSWMITWQKIGSVL